MSHNSGREGWGGGCGGQQQQRDVQHQKQARGNEFLRAREDTFRCGTTGGSQSKSSFFLFIWVDPLDLRKIHKGTFLGKRSPGGIDSPSALRGASSHGHLPVRWNGCLRENVWSVTPSLSCKTRCKQGLGLDPGTQSGSTNPVERLMQASCARQSQKISKEKANRGCRGSVSFHKKKMVVLWLKVLVINHNILVSWTLTGLLKTHSCHKASYRRLPTYCLITNAY